MWNIKWRKKISRKWVIAKAIWVLFNVLKTFHSTGGARPQYLNNWLNPIFAFSIFKNSIPALDWVLYSSGNVGTSIILTLLKMVLHNMNIKVNGKLFLEIGSAATSKLCQHFHVQIWDKGILRAAPATCLEIIIKVSYSVFFFFKKSSLYNMKDIRRKQYAFNKWVWGVSLK